jgi:hypothetical protein
MLSMVRAGSSQSKPIRVLITLIGREHEATKARLRRIRFRQRADANPASQQSLGCSIQFLPE